MTTTQHRHDTIAEVYAAAVNAHVPAEGKLVVAFSGGIDSTVLLHVTVSAGLRPLRAVYVDHGLQAGSAEWGEHCRIICAGYGIDFRLLQVQVDTTSGDSPEAAARRARYAALRADALAA